MLSIMLSSAFASSCRSMLSYLIFFAMASSSPDLSLVCLIGTMICNIFQYLFDTIRLYMLHTPPPPFLQDQLNTALYLHSSKTTPSSTKHALKQLYASSSEQQNILQGRSSDISDVAHAAVVDACAPAPRLSNFDWKVVTTIASSSMTAMHKTRIMLNLQVAEQADTASTSAPSCSLELDILAAKRLLAQLQAAHVMSMPAS